MIRLDNVYKRYRYHGGAKWVLNGVNLEISQGAKLALIGANGAGKSTLLGLIGGMDQPSRGTISRGCRVSWPLGLAGGFQGSLSGRQNVRFVCRIHGVAETMLAEHMAFVREFSELGESFDQPVKTYSSGMRSRLAFALSLVFNFDMYLVDELISVGDAAFRVKSRGAFQGLAQRAGLIMVSHDETTLRTFCTEAVWLDRGQIHQFASVDEALHAYRVSRQQ
ncbi:polysaccharide/polyol phosphate ABC transporter ATP-binding protein [Cupriavidus sp. UYMMa02A]|nr:polysaccharide/polyol phosphate ABC transporter ATP-binding protein [Cupriavidus sp. UYMMa02A]